MFTDEFDTKEQLRPRQGACREWEEVNSISNLM